MLDKNKDAFLALVRAGLWEMDVQLSQYGRIDYNEILRLSEEQSVIGLVTAGIEHVKDVKLPQNVNLSFAGKALQLEQQNAAMDQFIGVLIDKMRNVGIYTLLLKGQGLAQCYERPLWRCCGDVDLFLSEGNYGKAKDFLVPLASFIENEWETSKHLGMTVEGWIVEIHGSLRGSLSHRINSVLNEIRTETFYGGKVRSWITNNTQVFLLDINNDVIYVFSHFLNHFYKGGIGLRQICDWCRLLWKYKASLNYRLLETRLRKMGLMTEWRAFGAFAVDYLGMPADAMPFYVQDVKWKRKADRICFFIIEVGNFGHNRDMSYYNEKSYFKRKSISLGRRVKDFMNHARIFPADSLRFFPNILYSGIQSVIRGE